MHNGTFPETKSRALSTKYRPHRIYFREGVIGVQCRIVDLRCKEVINVCNGHRMGFVDDVLLDVEDGRIVALVVPGPCRILGLFGREDDYVIGWDRIKRIGDDIILVEVPGEYRREKRRRKSWL